FLLLPLSVNAGFNMNNVISDDDMTNWKSMSLKTISQFLSSKGGILSWYTTADKDGQVKSAAEIIYNASNQYQLSPKFIIAHLQKESSVVTSKTGTYIDWAMGYAVCDGCSKSDPRVVKYKGFTNQVYGAADRIRNGYLVDLANRNSTISGWGVGVPKTSSDGHTVTPANQATAVLYTYTPWVGYHGGTTSHGGNSLFWDIWQDWFPYVQTKYPDGTLLQSIETGTVYLIKNGKKRAFASKVALVSSFDASKIISVFDWVLDQYEDGIPYRFPNYTLLQDPNGTIYLYVNGKKRGITSQKAFKNLGYNPEEIVPIAWDELNGIPNGKPITEEDTYPVGAFFKVRGSKNMIYLDPKGNRHRITSNIILKNNFKYFSFENKKRKYVNKFKKGGPLKLKDGTLVATKSRASVFLIADGKRRPFENADAFNKLGYKFNNIVWIGPEILKMHNKGKLIKYKESGINLGTAEAGIKQGPDQAARTPLEPAIIGRTEKPQENIARTTEEAKIEKIDSLNSFGRK
ncbi:MAG: hypothetical protein ABH835_03755, partial [Patescibacteria group bacterium]